MKKIEIAPAPQGLGRALDHDAHRAQGGKPHEAAKEGVRVSSDWRLFADGIEVPVYAAPVTRGGPHSFAQVCYEGDEPIAFRAVRSGDLHGVEILPKSAGVEGVAREGEARFEIGRTGHYTLLADGDIAQPLTVSVCPIREVRRPQDVKGLYFAPGLHEIDTFDFSSGDTIYLAPGAVVTARKHPPEETPLDERDWAGQKNYRTCLMARDCAQVTVEGYGILDFSCLDWHERSPLVFLQCRDVLVRDVTMVNAPAWTLHFVGCEGVEADNVRIFGYRENSDGIDIVSTKKAYVHDCFVRTGDDAVVVKAMLKPPVCGGKDILCRKCVVWNDKVRCFGIAAESVNDVSDVRFEDCDVIRSYADWTLELGALVVYICDKAMVRNVVFRDIRIEHEAYLGTHVLITKDFWSKDVEAGNIRDVRFESIAMPDGVGSRVAGYGEKNTVEGVTYAHCAVGGKIASTPEELGLQIGAFTKDIRVL